MYVALNNFFSMRLHQGTWGTKNMQCSGLGTRGISFVGYGGVQNCFELRLCRPSYVQMLYLWDDSSSLIGRVAIVRFVTLSQKNYLLLTTLSLIAVNCMFEASGFARLIIFLCLLCLQIPASYWNLNWRNLQRGTPCESIKNYLYNLSYQPLKSFTSHTPYNTSGFSIQWLRFLWY